MISIEGYIREKRILIVKYNNKEFEIRPSNLLKHKIFYIVGNFKFTGTYKVEIGSEIVDHKRNISITGRFFDEKSREKFYIYSCNNCGWKQGKIKEKNLLDGIGCSCCSSRTIVVGINDIPTTAPWMVKYFQGGYDEAKLYTYGSSKRIYPICPYCGKEKDVSIQVRKIYVNRSIGCSCSDGKSYPEKFMASVLNQLNIDYKCEYQDLWLIDESGSRRKFDFCIDNLIIEMDGGFHITPHKDSKLTPEDVQYIDQWKDIQAHKAGFTVIRIDAYISSKEYLKKNIYVALQPYFELHKINWDKCDEYATKNIVKEVCEYYHNSNIKIISALSKHFNLSNTSIRNYLTRGSKLGWCIYPSEESINQTKAKMIEATIKSRSKMIAVYKNGIFLKKYDSIANCAKNSIVDFGVKFDDGCISSVANKLRKQHKGHTFKFINNAS